MRNHVGAIIGTSLGILLAFLTALLPGCIKTDSVLTPGKKITAPQLQAEVVQVQKEMSDEGTTIQQTLSAHRAEDAKLVQDYNAKATAENGKFAIASADLDQQTKSLQNVLSVVGGIANTVLQGATNPASLAGTALTTALAGLAGGSFFDSRQKQQVISSIRTTLPDPSAVPAGAPGSGPLNIILPGTGNPAPIVGAPVPYVVPVSIPAPAALANAA